MTWTQDEWDAFAALLEHGWPGDFTPDAGRAYRVLLDETGPAECLIALRRLVMRGGRFRPSVAEILAEAYSDPGKPTWSEAFALMFGARGLLSIRPEAACLTRAGSIHPLLQAFIEQQGYDRLRMLPVHDEDRGEWLRRDLGQAWDRFEARADERKRAGLPVHAVGGRAGLRRPDFAGAITPPPPPTQLDA